MVTTSETLPQILVWLQYHKAMGVSTFYLFVDGQAARPEVQEALRRIPGVRVVPRDAELQRKHETSRIWNETWLSGDRGGRQWLDQLRPWPDADSRAGHPRLARGAADSHYPVRGTP